MLSMAGRCILIKAVLIATPQYAIKCGKCNLTERIKVMVWRLFNEALPDAVNLRKRGCGVSMECQECESGNETALHVVKDCWKAKALWREVKVDERLVSRQGGSAADWLFQCAQEGGWGVFKKIMCGVWLLWNGRNELRHGKVGWSVEEMEAKLNSLIYQGEKYLGRKLSTNIPNALLMESDRDKLCIFCDGSWRGGGVAGMAAVAIDRGEVLAVIFKWCGQGMIGKEVEGEALCLGLNLAARIEAVEATIITDSLDVVNLAWLGCDRNGGGASWMSEFKNLMALRPGWVVKHTMREDNELADKMARFALETKSTWLNPWAMPKSLASIMVGA